MKKHFRNPVRRDKVTIGKIQLPVNVETFPIPFSESDSTLLVVPSQSRQRMAQIHYFLDLTSATGFRFEIDLTDHISFDDFQTVGWSHLPLGFASQAQWQGFCIGPHSDLLLAKNRFHVGLRAFNRFVEIDTETRTAHVVDPNVNDNFLSSTNWIDKESGTLWFASWCVQDSSRRYQLRDDPVDVSIWTLDKGDTVPKKIWSGHVGDFLHQLNISPGRRHLVLCEMGMRPAATVVPAGHPGNNPFGWRSFHEAGIEPSKILILDLSTGRKWTLTPPTSTAAHVEFSPEDSKVCYISCHNIGLVNGTNTLFGAGVIYCYELTDTGPAIIGAFTCPDFYRITSHQVFRYRDQLLIGVTGFPDKVFLIDARTMKLHRTIQLFAGIRVNTATQPHFCEQDARSPYGLVPSADGELIYVFGSGVLYIVEVETGRLRQPPWAFYKNPDQEAIAGHITIHCGD